MATSVENYPSAAVDRAMKVEEVLMRATAGKIMWWQAAEMIGISDRQMRRWRKRYEEFGYDGLLDRRRGVPSSKRVPAAQARQDLNAFDRRWVEKRPTAKGWFSTVVPLEQQTVTDASWNECEGR
jgi:transposase-like protein